LAHHGTRQSGFTAHVPQISAKIAPVALLQNPEKYAQTG